MPASHICPSCGTELARVAAGVEPVYGLRIAVCPGCRAAWVRQRHPLVAGWRRARKIAGALAVVVIQVAALTIAGVLIAQQIEVVDNAGSKARYGLSELVRTPAGRTALRAWVRADGRIEIGVLAGSAALAGVWLSATLGHIRPWRRFSGWYALLLAFLLLAVVDAGLPVYSAWLSRDAARYAGPRAGQLGARALIALGCVLVASAASPAGPLVARSAAAVRSRTLGKRRARIRRRRESV